VSVLLLMVIVVSLTVLTRLGQTTPWSPKMQAWSGDAVQPEFLRGRTPLQREGALVFQNMQCRNCHSLRGIGGQRGPDLSGVSVRMTDSQIIRQVLQGSGNMPAYGSAFSPQQLTALVSFLETLNGNVRPAQTDSRRLTPHPLSAPQGRQ
jgi:ubiquinol-cytochrome c reductase cytochrome b subunit